MNSLQLKGIQLSCVLTERASLIVSFGASSLKLEINFENRKRSPRLPACRTVQDWQESLALSIRLLQSGHSVFRLAIGKVPINLKIAAIVERPAIQKILDHPELEPQPQPEDRANMPWVSLLQIAGKASRCGETRP
jgi:hypothetical protein